MGVDQSLAEKNNLDGFFQSESETKKVNRFGCSDIANQHGFLIDNVSRYNFMATIMLKVT
ncbi:hypothetical protein Q7C_2180 [Methylophaga frappieri]|uniref:Uncharacterized protein n=1 Tax=Methylophaga frappieri (strain ATCC BAA-2434 / DSM 25690 / JAM7) TaxID=754477 RepID=I1YK73_METFJ|nr:hypothetical protein Q7C_2180 [Methylophaga frappieri]